MEDRDVGFEMVVISSAFPLQAFPLVFFVERSLFFNLFY